MFHQPWWLDIVTGRKWQALEVSEGGRTVGRMPIQVVRRFGGATAGMPPLTHFLGPALDEGGGSAATRWLRRVSITRELIRRLPPLLWIRQKCHRGITDAVPFQAERFGTHVQFTFEVAPAPEAVLWAALRDKTRNVIRKAQRQHTVEALQDGLEFTRFYRKNLDHMRRKDWTGASQIMPDLLSAALERDAGVLLATRDGAGALSAAIFCPHDTLASYYTLSTRRLDAGNGTIPLLIWEAMRRASDAGRMFDFDGLSNERVIGLYGGFGGVVRPRYVAQRSTSARLIRFVSRKFGANASTFGG